MGNNMFNCRLRRNFNSFHLNFFRLKIESLLFATLYLVVHHRRIDYVIHRYAPGYLLHHGIGSAVIIGQLLGLAAQCG